mmetsp:Transcript_32833/g.63225  ORF Transcript_32833/g.63225 Transcript_32833/m.63225 type:complete len:82 (+) Transcript_32833:819-1064(+)
MESFLALPERFVCNGILHADSCKTKSTITTYDDVLAVDFDDFFILGSYRCCVRQSSVRSRFHIVSDEFSHEESRYNQHYVH